MGWSSVGVKLGRLCTSMLLTGLKRHDARVAKGQACMTPWTLRALCVTASRPCPVTSRVTGAPSCVAAVTALSAAGARRASLCSASTSVLACAHRAWCVGGAGEGHALCGQARTLPARCAHSFLLGEGSLLYHRHGTQYSVPWAHLSKRAQRSTAVQRIDRTPSVHVLPCPPDACHILRLRSSS